MQPSATALRDIFSAFFSETHKHHACARNLIEMYYEHSSAPTFKPPTAFLIVLQVSKFEPAHSSDRSQTRPSDTEKLG